MTRTPFYDKRPFFFYRKKSFFSVCSFVPVIHHIKFLWIVLSFNSCDRAKAKTKRIFLHLVIKRVTNTWRSHFFFSNNELQFLSSSTLKWHKFRRVTAASKAVFTPAVYFKAIHSKPIEFKIHTNQFKLYSLRHYNVGISLLTQFKLLFTWNKFG